MSNAQMILHTVAVSMANFGAPMLLDKKDWNEAERMAEAGLLQRGEPILETFGYTLTDAGVEAFNEAFPPEPTKPPIKAWGNLSPKTMAACIRFIKKQCSRPLEDAYWLEVEDDKGAVESITLSRSALDKKLEELGYDRYTNEGKIIFSQEESYALYTCDVTGELLCGGWSSDPQSIAYELDGFSWRRREQFQMEERDWQEANAFIERLSTSNREEAKLRRLIAQSCFVEPKCVNDTGLINPGGGCQGTYEELISLFSFLAEEAPC